MHPPTSASGLSAVEVARLCAAEAKTLIVEGLGKAGVSGVKGRGNVVTEIDLAVEHASKATIRREYPKHAILSEETASEVRADGWMWVIDPVDGTKNFSRGIPHFCFTVALCHDHEPVVGLTLHPLLDEEFLAEKGKGAWLNGTPIRTTTATLNEAVVGIDLGYDIQAGAQNLNLAQDIWPDIQSLRILGSAALDIAFVAAGRWDVYTHGNLEPWDTAAGLLLVREAGGVAETPEGEPATIYSPAIAAGNAGILTELRARRAGP